MRSTLLFVLAIGCAGPPPEPEPIAEASSAAARWVTVRVPDDASLLSAPAVVRAPAASGEVSSLARVRVVRLDVEVGSTVAAGDPVLEVAAPELADAAATWARASDQARAHEARAAELQGLRAEGLVPSAQVFEVRARAAELGRERDRAGALLRSAGVEPTEARSLVRTGTLTLRAPVDGVVASLVARVGEIHEPGGEPLARIVGRAAARVEVRTSGPWPAARAVHLVTFDGQRVELSASPVATVVDQADGTRIAWFTPAGDDPLPDGLGGTVFLDPGEGTWEVPLGAVAQSTGQAEVVRRRGGSATRVPVEVLASAGASALVRGDLAEGDAVAAEPIEPDAPTPDAPAPEGRPDGTGATEDGAAGR